MAGEPAPGHLDSNRSSEEILRSIQALAQLSPRKIGERILVDTSSEVDLSTLVGQISAAFGRTEAQPPLPLAAELDGRRSPR